MRFQALRSPLSALSLAALLLTTAACTTGGGVTLPPLPAWESPAGAQPLAAATVATEARRLVPTARIAYSDSRYTVVSHAWLERYLAWTWEAAKIAGVTYTPESFDCEDFALGFHFFAARAAAKAGVTAAPLIARLIVSQPSTLNAQLSQRHALIGIVTDRGLFVVEPQPAAGPFRVTPLADYPHPILALTFGDLNP